MNNFVEHIVDQIATALNVPGFGLAHQTESGQVVVWNADNTEAQNVSLDDTKGNYFYIRTRTNTGYTERPTRRRGCGNAHEMRGAFRLVAVWRCAKPETLIYALKNRLNNAVKSYDNAIIKRIIFEGNNDNYEYIFRQETRQDAIKFNPGIHIVTIDFSLEIEYDACKLNDIDIC